MPDPTPITMNLADLAITSLETIQAYDTNGNYMWTLDELQNATIEQSDETVEITGKKGRKISSMKRNKAVTISGTNGLISMGLMATQVGSDFYAESQAVVRWYDYLTVQSNAATTSYKAIGTAGQEIIGLWTKDGAKLDTKLTQDSTAASGKFAYAPGTKTLTFSGVANGTEIFVIYERKIAADVMTNYSDKYSKKCKLYVDAIAEDKCSNQYHVQIFIPRADFNGNFSFEMGDNQSVHNFEAEALSSASGCGASTGGDYFWTMTVFGANAADAA